MINFREKWLPTLMLAILLHVGIFYILYISFSGKDDISQNTANKDNTSKSSTAIDLTSDYPAIQTQTDTSNSDKPKVALDLNSEPTESVTAAEKITPITIQNKLSATKAKNELELKSAETVKNTTAAKPNNKTQSLETKQLIPVDANVVVDDEYLLALKNEAGLLAMDVPSSNAVIKTNKQHSAMKLEVDQTNEQLSAAINEIKNRNQQKIDQRKQE
ncbi:hypothetical protein KPY62_13285 [Psychrobacter sp. TAE2020]|uniref:hypothetical protein n=1 Tax=Psychrobacter sp. TAE2020 TaxID=2846762 RepID=UPI001C10B556|nr:hypothetical protein [Psychrobacter sp. TAE2020]MBU5618045.1 hypothetical protein [Psychrobacter sp. TAE2020]